MTCANFYIGLGSTVLTERLNRWKKFGRQERATIACILEFEKEYIYICTFKCIRVEKLYADRNISSLYVDHNSQWLV